MCNSTEVFSLGKCNKTPIFEPIVLLYDDRELYFNNVMHKSCLELTLQQSNRLEQIKIMFPF